MYFLPLRERFAVPNVTTPIVSQRKRVLAQLTTLRVHNGSSEKLIRN